MEWVSGTFGSKVTMLYPTTILKGEGAKMEYLGMSLASGEQILDSGAKAISLADNTSQLSGWRRCFEKWRRQVVHENSGESREGVCGGSAYIDCKSLILDSESRAESGANGGWEFCGGGSKYQMEVCGENCQRRFYYII